MKTKSERLTAPPGQIKILKALESLLENKEFGAVTWAEIAEAAKVNEALIYKYFGSKRKLLHHLLGRFLQRFIEELRIGLMGIEGAVNKLRKFVWFHIDIYNEHRVFAKILVLEVRNYPGYFESTTYEFAREFGGILTGILEEGIKHGEFRDDIPVEIMRQIVLGDIEHVCLPRIIFELPIDTYVYAELIMKLLVGGIRKSD